MAPLFNDIAFRAIAYALDGLSLRQRVTANNIANVDTPGYKAQHVQFEEQLRRALRQNAEPELPLETTTPGHITGGDSTVGPVSVQQQNNNLRNDGNNVDIDLEMTTLAETTLRYQALSQLASMKISLLKTVLRDIK